MLLTSNSESAYYNFKESPSEYGYVYNIHTVTDERNMCPEGWHIPIEAEWNLLIDNLGGPSVAGGKLKEAGYLHWNECEWQYTPGTNESGFTALPGGAIVTYYDYSTTPATEKARRYVPGGDGQCWWASDKVTFPLFFLWSCSNRSDESNPSTDHFIGASVRCVKDPK